MHTIRDVIGRKGEIDRLNVREWESGTERERNLENRDAGSIERKVVAYDTC